MKNLALTLFLVMLSMGGYAMIETLSLEQLAQGADLVVSGRIAGVRAGETKTDGVEVVASLFEIKECLKGGSAAGEKIRIRTWRGIEDNVDFVEGKSYLLFLRAVDNHYEVFNSPQGSWPVEADGSFSGMGHGKSIEQVKAAIASRPLKFQPEFKPLSL
ncbi:MAG: hypothetical protein CVV42_03305 [Candidatus Riflebacteria bacterium HGW-Riflebacteria-2]|nr:MAG: hypothetical protein CVV42_03305 [Candidatus Riflebacteria bacterium HGW-Riflebacteria-2]